MRTATFRPVSAGEQWQVEVNWSDGEAQHLSGYISHAEAVTWTRYYSAQWLEIAIQDPLIKSMKRSERCN